MSRFKSTRPMRRPEFWCVLIALSLVSVCYYGLRAAAVYGLAIVTAVATDLLCLFLQSRPYRWIDLSNVANAVILAMMLPATIPYSIVILGTVFMVAVGTHVFGSRRDYLFPPPAVGYLFILLSWRKELRQFPQVGVRLALFGNDVELSPSLSSAYNATRLLTGERYDLFLGIGANAMATGCILLLTVCFFVLLFRRQVSLWASVGYLFGIAMMLLPGGFRPDALLMTNMIVFALLFLVADPCVMPCRSILAYPAAAATSFLMMYLIITFQMEDAPVIAVMLTVPLWHAFAKLETRLFKPVRVDPDVEDIDIDAAPSDDAARGEEAAR